MALTAAQILAANDMGLLKVEVPEWKPEGSTDESTVHIRVMSVGERDEYERLWIGRKETGVENFRTQYLARVLCDEKGDLLFSRDDIKALSNKSGAVMGRLFDVAMKHNRMSEEDVQELGKA